jgi:hypothetical protein
MRVKVNKIDSERISHKSDHFETKEPENFPKCITFIIPYTVDELSGMSIHVIIPEKLNS